MRDESTERRRTAIERVGKGGAHLMAVIIVQMFQQYALEGFKRNIAIHVQQ
jgi:hypothetical protein